MVIESVNQRFVYTSRVGNTVSVEQKCPQTQVESSVCKQHPVLDAWLERQVPQDRVAGQDASGPGWEPRCSH